MKPSIFLFTFLLASTLQSKESSLYESFLDQVAEEVFLSPREKEETEISKRVGEKNVQEISQIRTILKFYLKHEGYQAKIQSRDEKSIQELILTLEGIPNLGGFLWNHEKKVLFQWGDWADYYEDGFSQDKLRKEGQLPSFTLENDQFYFFVRNTSGYFPVDFQFLGWEANFYAFGDDGFLRYTNDEFIDLAIRTTEFRKIFETIKQNIPHCEIIEQNDLRIFIVPGKTRPLYFALFCLRIFLYLWTAYLFWHYIQTAFPFLKKKLPENPPPSN